MARQSRSTFTTDSFTQYMSSVTRYPVLGEKAQLLHCRRIAAWMELVELPEPGSLPPPLPSTSDPEHLHIEKLGRRSLNTMVNTNLRVVVKIVQKYTFDGVSLDRMDLIQEGNLGLLRGLIMFDPTKGYRVSTYVYWWIRQNIVRALRNKGRTIRIPISAAEAAAKINKIIEEYQQTRFGAIPNRHYIANEAAMSVSRVTEVLQLMSETSVVSLDKLVTDNQGNLLDLLDAVPDTTTVQSHDEDTPQLSPEDADQRNALRDMIQELPYMEAYVIEEHFLEQRRIEEVAEDLGVTVTKAKKIMRTTLHRLKAKLIYHRYRAQVEAPKDF